MSICREWTIVNHHTDGHLVKPLKCRAWNCDYCAPERRAQLMALAASGEPTRFITLTINPKHGSDPADRLKALSRAWRLIVKRLRRARRGASFEYLAIVEATKKGEPHLHILYRGPYVLQTELSSWMAEIADSPIVDIRRIKNQGEVIRYVAKYITKNPTQFGRSKRYWHSRGYELDPPTGDETEPGNRLFTEVIKRPIDLVLWDYACRSYRFRRWNEETIIATPTYLDEIGPFITVSGNVLIRREEPPP